MAKKEKSDYLIQAVSHALDLLEQFHGETDELGVTELSKRLKLHKNNVFRLLATLESRGYIEQNKVTENYRLGLKTLELGQTFIRQAASLLRRGGVLWLVANRHLPYEKVLAELFRTATPRQDTGGYKVFEAIK